MLTEAQAILAQIVAGNLLAAAILFVFLRAACILGGPFVFGGALDIVGISAFGTLPAFVLAEIGIMLGASLAFVIGRRFKHKVLRWRWLANQITFWEGRLERREQFAAWTLIRLCTNPLFDIISYAAGLTNSSFRMFFFSTLLGNVPSMALFFAFGGLIVGGSVTTGLLGMVVLLLIGAIAYRRIKMR